MTKAKAGKAASREHDRSRRHSSRHSADQASRHDSTPDASPTRDAAAHADPATTAASAPPTSNDRPSASTTDRRPRGAMTDRYTVWAGDAHAPSEGSSEATAPVEAAPIEAASDAQSMGVAWSQHQPAGSAGPIPGDRTRVRAASVLRTTPPGLELTTIRRTAPAATTGAARHAPMPGSRTPRPRMAKRTSSDRQPETIRAADDIAATGVTAMPRATDTTSHPDLRARRTRSVGRPTGDAAAAGSAAAANQPATPAKTDAGPDTGEHRILPFERGRDRHEQAGRSGPTSDTAGTPGARQTISTDKDRAEAAPASVEGQASEEANEAARERDGREDGEERPGTGPDTTPAAITTSDQPDAATSITADTAQQTQAAPETGATGEAEPDTSSRQSAANVHESWSGSTSETRETGAGNETDTKGQPAAQIASIDDSDAAAANVAGTGRRDSDEDQDLPASSVSHAQAQSAATASGVAATISGAVHDMVDRARGAAAGAREPAARTAGQVRGVLSGSGAPGAANASPSQTDQGSAAIGGAIQRPLVPLLAGAFALMTLTGLSRWLVRKLTGADVRVLGPRNVRGTLFGAGLIAMIAGWLLFREDER